MTHAREYGLLTKVHRLAKFEFSQKKIFFFQNVSWQGLGYGQRPPFKNHKNVAPSPCQLTVFLTFPKFLLRSNWAAKLASYINYHTDRLQLKYESVWMIL